MKAATRPETGQGGGAVRVRSRGGPHPVGAARVRAMATRMLRAAGREQAELSVVLVDDSTIQRLNREYRAIDRPTDVLSFPMLEGDFAGLQPELLGDVAISIPTAARQAKRARRSLEHEVAHLLAHGILHLLGMDHDTRRREAVMRKETERLVEAALERA
jgi:probable rRNA maturation factor